MLEGQALVLTQVAEYKESSKPGSFTTLSSSLGQILMQLHTGRGLLAFTYNLVNFFDPKESMVGDFQFQHMYPSNLLIRYFVTTQQSG
jgi:hypothetical protein